MRELFTRIGVVVCVAVAAYIGAGRLDDTIAVFDFRADLNASLTYRDRTYLPGDGLAGDWRVLEDARLWMPEDASYDVVFGSPTLERRFGNVAYFLYILLWPRAQAAGPDARWVFCYGCTRSTLGPGHEVLSDSGKGLLFARRNA